MKSFLDYINEGALKDLLIKYSDAVELISKLGYDDDTAMSMLADLSKIKNPQKKAIVTTLKKNKIKDKDVSSITTKILGA